MEWVFPSPAHRLESVAAWLGLFLEPRLYAGQVDVDDEVKAAAVWGAAGGDSARSLPTIGGLLAALVGPDHAAKIGAGLSAALAPLAPTGASAYLQFLAVDEAARRRGLGTAVLQRGFDRAADAGLGVHLETTSPDSLTFYEALGFDQVAVTTLPPDGPQLWALRKPGVKG